MASRVLIGFWVGSAGAAGIVALIAGTDLSIVLPAAALSILAATGAGVTVLWDRVRMPPSVEAVPPATASIPLWEAFHSGVLGRQTVIATLHQLQQETTGGSLPALGDDEEQALLAMSGEQFRRWADAQMTALEAVT